MIDEKLQTNINEFSRCEERTWSQLDESDHRRLDKADEALEDSIHQALWNDSVLRLTDLDQIEIHARKGVAYLSGYLTSTTNRSRVEKALEAVDGLRGVQSELVVDDQLTFEVAASLAELEHKYQCKFFTGVSHGVVALNGEVGSLEVRTLAEQYAARNPQTRGVLNYISVPGFDQDPQEHRFFQPAIGGDINFRDGAAGAVEQVIINPDNRLVVAAVIKGHIVDALQPAIAQMSSQLWVIPMSTMEYLTNNSGFLTINSTDVSRYQKFNANDFITPWADWAPPYPYCSRDVLFPVEYHQPGKIEGKADEAPSSEKAGEKALEREIDHNDSLGG